MTKGTWDYSHMKDRELLLLAVQKIDELDGLPRRVASLERKASWLAGIGAAISALFTVIEARRH